MKILTIEKLLKLDVSLEDFFERLQKTNKEAEAILAGWSLFENCISICFYEILLNQKSINGWQRTFLETILRKHCHQKPEAILQIFIEATGKKDVPALNGKDLDNVKICRNRIAHNYHKYHEVQVKDLDKSYNLSRMMIAISKAIQEVYQLYKSFPDEINEEIAEELAREAALEDAYNYWRGK